MLNNVILNEAETLKQWSGFITESTGVTDRSKLTWMSKYCAFHKMAEDTQLNESVHGYAHMNPGMNVGGMGAITFPNGGDYHNAEHRGSGDNPFSLLPLAVQVAAQTIALDLVPVVPMQGPLGLLQYMDYVYEGGKLNHRPDFGGDTASNTAPALVKVILEDSWLDNVSSSDFDDKMAPITFGDYELTYAGLGRVDAMPIFSVKTGGHLNGEFAAAKLPLAVVLKGKDIDGYSIKSVETVKAMEDFIPGFTGKGIHAGEPMSTAAFSREEGESTPSQMMSLNTYTLEVKADTIQVKGAITREQMQDLKTYGIDAVAQVEAALVNELTQHINRDILNRMFKLGDLNAKRAAIYDGVKLNTFFSVVEGERKEGFETAYVGGGAETLGTVQRRIMSKLLAASNVIAVRGRRGAANFAVCSGLIATALQDCAGFVAYPLSNTINQTAGSLYPVGAISGITIYVDPAVSFSDTKVCVGRKGKDNEPGLVFMPYLMADKLSYPSEGMEGAPVTSLKSRYAIVEAGHHPETMYMTIDFAFGAGAAII